MIASFRDKSREKNTKYVNTKEKYTFLHKLCVIKYKVIYDKKYKKRVNTFLRKVIYENTKYDT